MKTTIVLALATSGLTKLGVTEVAELTYLAAAVAAWTYGGRAIANAMSGTRVQVPSPPPPHHVVRRNRLLEPVSSPRRSTET